MKPAHPIRLILIPLLALTGLTACNGDGSSEQGIRVTANSTYLNAETADGAPDYGTDPQHEESGIKPLYRSDNMFIELQLGLVNLRVTELTRCESTAAAAARRVLDFVFPAAMAHAGHIPDGPAGVIDVLKPDLLVWDLGGQAATPGNYCGLVLAINPVEISSVEGDSAHEGEEHAEADGVDMSGAGIMVSPCYYPDTAGTPRSELDSETGHACIEAAYRGATLLRTLEFAEPLTLNSANRAANVLLATAYNSWFDGLDMGLLGTSEAEQGRLAQNVINSFYVMEIE